MIKIVMTYINTIENKNEVQRAVETLEKDFRVMIRNNLQNKRESSKKHFINIELETKNNNL